ncbi:hypothetical protein M4I32_03345 [Microbacterium sp. LRZ72]|uniref:hypothetical protein n=1 Tax=Microbacterium sp. LRZ72 TaxID=2942481 RepID=UPI0029A24155|nr:hypothetical protein [Microbacterium sp. LRZ72]MDX2375831.1 hypothetical protein [Microbacterium sp. LRZ72]
MSDLPPPVPPAPAPRPEGTPPRPPLPGAPTSGDAAPAARPSAPPAGAAGPPSGRPKRGLGVTALVVALVTLIVSPTLAAVAAFAIGDELATSAVFVSPAAMQDLSFLAPVRGWVLLAELAFWGGTVLGIWAIAQGVVAIVRNRGRGAGIGAVVVAVLAALAFGLATYLALAVGVAMSGGAGM